MTTISRAFRKPSAARLSDDRRISSVHGVFERAALDRGKRGIDERRVRIPALFGEDEVQHEHLIAGIMECSEDLVRSVGASTVDSRHGADFRRHLVLREVTAPAGLGGRASELRQSGLLRD